MPCQEPAIQTLQERGFRTSFRGFDKNDVLAYMNALANETQQRESEYEEEIAQLKSQLDKLRSEQTAARACVEKLQSDLSEANSRAEAAEKDAAEAQTRAQAADERATNYHNRLKENQQAVVEWQFKCRDLQKQVDEMTAMIPKGGSSAPAPEPVPAPEPAQPAMPEPVAPPPSAPETSVTEEARIEARRILMEARLKAQSAELRLQQQADEQKARMADHARDLAAGIALLRERVGQADERLSAASFDLEDATAALYQALAATETDFEAFGVQLRDFGETDAAEPLTGASDAPETQANDTEQFAVAPSAQPLPSAAARPVSGAKGTVRCRAAAQPVSKRARPVRPQQNSAPVRRLRRATRERRSVSQELTDALNRLDQK